MKIQEQDLIKIQDQDITDLDILEDKKTQCGMINRDHRISLDHRILLDVLAVNVIGATRI